MVRKVALLKRFESGQLESAINDYLKSDKVVGFVLKDIKFEMQTDGQGVRYCALIIMEEESE